MAPPAGRVIVPSSYKPAVLELDAYCREHGLTGSESQHELPSLPHCITIRMPSGSKLEAAGWTPESAATAMLRRLHA